MASATLPSPAGSAKGGSPIPTVKRVVLIEEWVQGPTQRLALHGGGASVGGAVRLARSIAATLGRLAGAHDGFVHGDQKPSNIVLHPVRGPVLIDHGLATHGAGAWQRYATASSGTWSSPERMDGRLGLFTGVGAWASCSTRR